MLSRVNMAFNALTSANTDDALQKTQEDVAPLLAAHFDAIYLDPKLFARIEAIYKHRDALNLDPNRSAWSSTTTSTSSTMARACPTRTRRS